MDNAPGKYETALVYIALNIGWGWKLIYVARCMALAALDRLKWKNKHPVFEWVDQSAKFNVLIDEILCLTFWQIDSLVFCYFSLLAPFLPAPMVRRNWSESGSRGVSCYGWCTPFGVFDSQDLWNPYGVMHDKVIELIIDCFSPNPDVSGVVDRSFVWFRNLSSDFSGWHRDCGDTSDFREALERVFGSDFIMLVCGSSEVVVSRKFVIFWVVLVALALLPILFIYFAQDFEKFSSLHHSPAGS